MLVELGSQFTTFGGTICIQCSGWVGCGDGGLLVYLHNPIECVCLGWGSSECKPSASWDWAGPSGHFQVSKCGPRSQRELMASLQGAEGGGLPSSPWSSWCHLGTSQGTPAPRYAGSWSWV